MSQQLWWYAVRASGVVAWVLVTASVVWGLVLSSRSTKRPRPAWVLDLHRFLGALTFVFLAIHLVGLLFDKWVGFGPRELFVPMASEYRPGALTWGIIALYGLAVVEVSSRLMRHLPKRVWHSVHLVSFVVFATTTVHVLTAGTDSQRLPTIVFAWASCALVVFLLAFRIVVRVLASQRRSTLRKRLAAHEPLPARSVGAVDDAIEDLVRRDRVARHGHHRSATPRSTPR